MRFKLLLCFCVLSLAVAQRNKDAKLRKELESPYKQWLDVDVAYIITDPERAAFLRLSNDDEREQFIEQFWLRRDPTPDTQENEFKEEHYRRIAYANEHFASGIPGWKTDRGMIYIKYGPPDEIDSHASGGTYRQTPEEGSAPITTFPFERWRYRYIEDIGANVVIEFVDQTMSGEYRLTIDPTEKNALLHTPMGQQQPLVPVTTDEFEPLRMFSILTGRPKESHRDLEATVKSNFRYNTLPLKVRTDFIPVTPASGTASITVLFDSRDLEFQAGKATVNIYARISTLSRRTASVFEDVVSLDERRGSAVYQKTVPLAPGRYRLNIVAKDVLAGNNGSYETALDVPQFQEDTLSASSLILADLIEPVPANSIGEGQFVIGDMKVRPRVGETFRRDEKLGIYVQLYHFATDVQTHKPNGEIRYQITRDGTGEVVLDYSEEAIALEGSASQVTVKKWLPLDNLAPGSYALRITVTDRKRKQTITPAANFTITNR